MCFVYKVVVEFGLCFEIIVCQLVYILVFLFVFGGYGFYGKLNGSCLVYLLGYVIKVDYFLVLYSW